MEFLLSDIRRDANGSVFYVGATMLTWLLENDPTVWRHSFRSDWLFYDILPVFYRMPVFTPYGRRISSTRRSTATLHYPMTSDCIRWHPAGKNGRHPPQLCKGRTCNIFKNYVKRMSLLVQGNIVMPSSEKKKPTSCPVLRAPFPDKILLGYAGLMLTFKKAQRQLLYEAMMA